MKERIQRASTLQNAEVGFCSDRVDDLRISQITNHKSKNQNQKNAHKKGEKFEMWRKLSLNPYLSPQLSSSLSLTHHHHHHHHTSEEEDQGVAMEDQIQPPDGALPFSDVTALLAAAASAEKQQALVARIYFPPPSDPASSSSVDRFAQLSNTAKQLQEFIKEHTRSSDYLGGQDYIWHREPPSISVVSPPSSSRPSTSKAATQQLPPHILFHLRTGGECIEDEWYATHLLIRLTTHFAPQQLCISVEDEDGQFLLIEAADHLPDWVTPEAVTNRVWIFEGHLHLIPPHHKSNDDASISAADALRLLADKATHTRASDDIEAGAFARAYEFPSAAKHHHHSTLAYLPRRVAQVLTSNPQLISSCVSSIQSRDIVSSRSGSRLVYFPPPASQASSTTAVGISSISADSNEIVLTPVPMTRHLYAQLLYDRFFPPRQLGPQWQAAVEKYRVRMHHQTTASAETKIEDQDQVQMEIQQGRWRDLGAKIWCGLEMAYTESLSRRTRTKARPMTTTEPAISAGERQKLVSSLSKLGYFQGEIEDSAKWKQLEAEALSQYLKATSSVDSEDDTVEGLLCDSVDQTLQHATSNSTPLKTFPANAPLPTLKAAEDEDSWLHLTPEDIESVLQSKSSSAYQTSPRAVDEEDTFQRLNAFNSKMSDFVLIKSDIQGALFADELKDEDMQLDDDDLLFEDLDEDEQEEKVKAEVEKRMKMDGEEEKRKLVERLIPRMSDDEWMSKPVLSNHNGSSKEEGGEEDFLTSIDRIAAERNPISNQQNMEGGRKVATRNNNLSAAHAELQRRLASQYMRETCTLLSSQGHQRYDGASDSDDEELEEETCPEVRKQRAREFDIEPDDLVHNPTGVAEAEWEDIAEPQMQDEETEVSNLLEFARISLGLTKEQYDDILTERRSNGKFVPSSQPCTDAKSPPKEPAKLDTFESVIAAMESQLDQLQSSNASRFSSSSWNKPSAPPLQKEEKMEEEEEELLSHFVKSGSDLPSSLLSHLHNGSDIGEAEQIEGFLRSFQAQSATFGVESGSGPVEVLMRRFGLGSLPVDQDT